MAFPFLPFLSFFFIFWKTEVFCWILNNKNKPTYTTLARNWKFFSQLFHFFFFLFPLFSFQLFIATIILNDTFGSCLQKKYKNNKTLIFFINKPSVTVPFPNKLLSLYNPESTTPSNTSQAHLFWNNLVKNLDYCLSISLKLISKNHRAENGTLGNFMKLLLLLYVGVWNFGMLSTLWVV